MGDNKERIIEIRTYANPTANMKLNHAQPSYQQMMEREIQQQKFLEVMIKKYSRGGTSHQIPKSKGEIRAQQAENAMRNQKEFQRQRKQVESIVKQLKRPY